MHPTRRDFVRLGLGSSTLLACGATVPTFLARSAAALPGEAYDRVLVVVQLDGGNDGLNTVVPYADEDYRKHRPTLHVKAEQVRKLDRQTGLHPSMEGMARLFEKDRVAIVQSVGYPNPNRSHFESMAIWQTARLKPAEDTRGWLARPLDRLPDIPGGDAPALHIGERSVPHALYGSKRQVPSLESLEQFRRRLGVPEGAGATEQRAALDRIAGQPRGEPDSLLQFVQRSTVITYASSARLESVRTAPPAAGGARFGLSRRLTLIAQLIKAGLSTAIYYTQLGNFDTHANQLSSHGFLLRELSESLSTFMDDLEKSGAAKRVLVLVFSEFGRRLRENASGGTDHGTAAPVFLVGENVRGGLHGASPNLQDLDSGGDPRFAIDFRRVYATILDQWLQCPSRAVLGDGYAHVQVLRPT